MLAQEMGLPDGEAGTIIRRLAETVDDVGLRGGFETAVSVQVALKKSEGEG